MPPIRTSDHPKLVSFTCNHRKVALARPTTHAAAVRLAKKTFPILKHIPGGRIKFSATVPDFPSEGEVEISPEAWQIAINGVDSFIIGVMEQKMDRGTLTRPARPQRNRTARVRFPVVGRPPPALRDRGRRREISITARLTTAAATMEYIVGGLGPSHRILDLKAKIHEASGICASEQTLWLGETVLQDNRLLSEYSITQGAVIRIVRSLGFAKPVIYLYPPTPLKATVKVSLSRNWRFSALYPSTVTGSFKHGQTAEWNVLAEPNGVMTVDGTSDEVAYLFWEAESSSSIILPDTPPTSRSPSPLPAPELQRSPTLSSFIPRITRCSPDDSVMMLANDVPSYLGKALLALGLHTEARTSFITYWLPSFLKHKHIALRFVSQSDYEGAAPLEVSPQPDVVTRIFMVFQGITADRLEAWQKARDRSLEPVDFWKGVVGTDEFRQSDRGLFRVLEWGGMEIQ